MTLQEIVKNLPEAMSQEDLEKYTKLYYETHDEKIRQKLIEGNLRLIVKVISDSFTNNIGIDEDDLFQICCIKLDTAIEGFNPNLGVKFSTYAYPVLQTAVYAELLYRQRHVFVPDVSLDSPAYDSEDSSESLADITADNESTNFISEIQNRDEFRFIINKILNYFHNSLRRPNERDIEMFWAYYGIDINNLEQNEIPKSKHELHVSFDELADRYGISRQRAHQIVKILTFRLKHDLFPDKRNSLSTSLTNIPENYAYKPFPDFIDFKRYVNSQQNLEILVKRINLYFDQTLYYNRDILASVFWNYYQIDPVNPKFENIPARTGNYAKVVKKMEKDFDISSYWLMEAIQNLSKDVKKIILPKAKRLSQKNLAEMYDRFEKEL